MDKHLAAQIPAGSEGIDVTRARGWQAEDCTHPWRYVQGGYGCCKRLFSLVELSSPVEFSQSVQFKPSQSTVPFKYLDDTVVICIIYIYDYICTQYIYIYIYTL